MKKKPKPALATGCMILLALVSCDLAQSSDLDKDLTCRMKSMHAPGMQIALVRGDRVVWQESFGLASTAAQTPMRDDHLLMIGSISKTLACTIIMQLAEEGKLDLDADINKYLPFGVRSPHFPDAPISARLLMSHRSGILDNWYYQYETFPDHSPLSIEAFLRAYLLPGGSMYDAEKNWYRDARPGQMELYSNAGITLLAYLAEVIEQKPFQAIATERLITPLGMDGGWHPDQVDPSLLAQGAELNGTPTHASSFYAWPAGSYLSSAASLARFVAIYADNGSVNGRQFLKPESISAMLTPADAKAEHGLGWQKGVAPMDGVSYWGHGGKTAGFNAQCFFDRDARAGIVLLTNGDEMDTYAFYEITRLLMRKALEYPL
jgi:CubicO group peptidase (beta-lactamase class C family)